MKTRVYGSIFLTAVITLLLTASLLLAVVYSSMSQDVCERLANECRYITDAVEQDEGKMLAEIGRSYVDRVTWIDSDGTVLYDNRTAAEKMSNHLARPEIAGALQNGVGQSSRLSDTLDERTYYYAKRLEDGTVLRVAATSASSFGALRTAVPWIVLIFVLALLVAGVLADRLTGAFLAPILALDLHDPMKTEAYDELSPLLHRMAEQNRRIDTQMQELRRRQAEFDDITARMDEGLVLFAATGQIVFANRAVRDLFPKDSAEGSYLTLCRDAEYIRVVEQALGGAPAHGKMERNGRVYELSASSAGGEGQNHAAALFVLDVTEREQAERRRQEFTANVSHELKTPLTSIMGYAEIMENGIVKAEDIGRFSGKIRAEAVRLLTLIEDIIRLSQLDEGGGQAPDGPVELLALCGTVRDRLLHKAAENHVTLTVDGMAQTVCGQRQILEQMVFNLTDNAIAYNRRNGSVTVSVGERDGAPFVRVADTGIGIAPADQQRVFERFYRVDKSHSKLTGGTGLGLSIVKHGALLHHAKIELKSTLGKGTEITIRFPQGQ